MDNATVRQEGEIYIYLYDRWYLTFYNDVKLKKIYKILEIKSTSKLKLFNSKKYILQLIYNAKDIRNTGIYFLIICTMW